MKKYNKCKYRYCILQLSKMLQYTVTFDFYFLITKLETKCYEAKNRYKI